MAIIAVGMEAIAIVAMGITDRIIGRFTIIRLLATAPLITARPRRSFLGLDSADFPGLVLNRKF
jgi:hypothetical protein